MPDSSPVVAGIVKVDRELDEPQPQYASVKIEILLGLASDGGVVNTEEFLVVEVVWEPSATRRVGKWWQ
jgi:hypothetical protein